jgi:hypothetical protein
MSKIRGLISGFESGPESPPTGLPRRSFLNSMPQSEILPNSRPTQKLTPPKLPERVKSPTNDQKIVFEAKLVTKPASVTPSLSHQHKEEKISLSSVVITDMTELPKPQKTSPRLTSTVNLSQLDISSLHNEIKKSSPRLPPNRPTISFEKTNGATKPVLNSPTIRVSTPTSKTQVRCDCFIVN